MNFAMLLVEAISSIYYYYAEGYSSWIFFALSIIATLFTAIIFILLIFLAFKPTTGRAITSCGLVLFMELLYLFQAVLTIVSDPDEASTFDSTMVAVFFVIYFWSSILLYRLWEFLLFNYDDSVDLLSETLIGVDGRTSIGGLSTRNSRIG